MQENKNNEAVAEDVPASEKQAEEKGTKSAADKKKIKKLEEELAAATARADDINEKYMRMLAEYDNFRKRSAKEREGVYADAVSDTLTSILPVLDNLERAEGCGDTEGLAKGLELTLKSFRDTLERLGIQEIEALGKTFDPNIHNAVFHVDDDAYGESEIVEVLVKGYMKGDKVVRYAVVKVAN